MLKRLSLTLLCIHVALSASPQSEDGQLLWQQHNHPAGNNRVSLIARGLSSLADLKEFVSTELGDGLSRDTPFSLGPDTYEFGRIATDYFEKSIERLRGMTTRDEWYEFLDGVEAEHITGEPAVAAEKYRLAAEAGVSQAMLLWGRALASGHGVEQNVESAAYWFTQATQTGDPYLIARSKEETAWILSTSATTGELDQEAVLEEAAKSHASAIPAYLNYLIAVSGLPETDDDVNNWVRRAAEAGNVSAQRFLFKTASSAEQDDIVSALKQIDNPRSHIALADIYRQKGQKNLAYDEYLKAAGVDPYALAQASLIVLEEGVVDGRATREQAVHDLDVAARLGEPSAALALAEMEPDPNQKYNLVRRAEGQDPNGRYASPAISIRQELCQEDGTSACEEVQVAYITNRALSDDAGQGAVYANKPAAGDIHTGVARVVIRTAHQEIKPPSLWSWLQSIPCKMFRCSSEKPRIDAPIVEESDHDIASFLGEIKKQFDRTDDASRRVILYFHGFNSSFVHAAEQLALIMSRGIVGIPILISWPSGGEATFHRDEEGPVVAAYRSDRTRAELSCPELARVLSMIVSTFGADSVNVLAHSMGAHLVSFIVLGCGGSLEGLDIRTEALSFAAADIGVQHFRMYYPRLRSSTEHLTLHVTTNDLALITSRKANAYRPVGLGGSGRFVEKGAVTVDVTRFENRAGVLNHGVVFDVPRVAADVVQVLNGKTDVVSRRLKRMQDGAYELLE